ncbi:MAG: MBL fold metallo-hydrolase [Candidatus Zhuqueibacterota bacterium]
MNPKKVTILYDNYVFTPGTASEWGFSCLVQGFEKTILFDTGGKGDILMSNIGVLGVDLKKVDIIVLSHNHWDHTGGLFNVLEKNPNVTVYAPKSFPDDFIGKVTQTGAKIERVDQPLEVCRDVILTGEIAGPVNEQSLILKTKQGAVVITGCSHPGIVKIVKKASEVVSGRVYMTFGGFHLMRHSEAEVDDIIRELRALGLVKCGATHCTGEKAIGQFKSAFGEDFLQMGTGNVIEIPE